MDATIVGREHGFHVSGLWTGESSGHNYTTRATFWPRVSDPTVLVIVFISVAVPLYDVSHELVCNIWALYVVCLQHCLAK